MSDAEHAICCFESVTNQPVVVHDLCGRFWNELPWQRFRHSQPVCQRVKAGKFSRRCEQFEINEFRARAHRHVNGRVHRCHAGLVELVQPVIDDGGLLLVLFAGPFLVEDSAVLDHSDELSGETQAADKKLPFLNSDQVVIFQELLRQLGARLLLMMKDQPRSPNSPSGPRRLQVERFLSERLNKPVQLKHLAEELHLSPERCRHAVLESCGIGFSKLLRQMRLKLACSLLLNTNLTIDRVAAECGMPDVSGFTRAFRQSYGLSPGRWRKRNRG